MSSTPITPITRSFVEPGGRTLVEQRPIFLGFPESEPRSFVGAQIAIGSAQGNDLVIENDSISRYHARIEVEASGIRLLDLQSTNGTFVGGFRVESVFLPEQTQIQLGQVVIDLKVGRDYRALEVSKDCRFGLMLGESIAMRRCFWLMARAAPSELPVLVVGESGTGKELAGRTLHDKSPRKERPFVVVDCGALPAGVAEVELFGCLRGAYTGAERDRRGAFEQADRGTIFLDEIGELPSALQPKLLRVLESGQVRPVGAEAYRSVDVRVIAATHRDLPAMVSRGEFREDLYHRLNVIRIDVPPLRRRLDDIRLLSKTMLEDIYRRNPDSAPMQLSDKTVEMLRRRRWVGNVRELRNVLERSVVMETLVGPPTVPVASVDCSEFVRFDRPYGELRDGVICHFEHQFLTKALEEFGGNVSRIARSCDMSRGNLIRLIKKYDLR